MEMLMITTLVFIEFWHTARKLKNSVKTEGG